jgi:hypothetical protein
MKQKEIFNLLAMGLIDDMPQGQEFKESVLNIMRLDGVVEFNSYIIDGNGEKVNLEVTMGYKYAKAVLELYAITQTQEPIHVNWNKAKYTLFPPGNMKIEYIFDEELQKEIDLINRQNKLQ